MWNILVILFSVFVLYRLYILAKTRRARSTPYSQAVGGTGGTTSEGPATRSWRTNPSDPLPSKLSGASTLHEVLLHAEKTHGDRSFAGTRPLIKTHAVPVADGKTLYFKEMAPFKWITYNQFAARVRNYGSGIRKLLELQPGDLMGLYDDTRLEWTLCEHACFSHSITVVTVYANLSEDGFVYAMQQGPIHTLQTNANNLKLIASLLDKLPDLRTIVYADDLGSDKNVIAASETIRQRNIKLLTLQQVEEAGAQDQLPSCPPSPDQLAVIMYTSGSTGPPKGVMITHGNMIGALAGVMQLVGLSSNDVYLSFLPLAHVLALVVEAALIYSGATIGYGSPRTLADSQVKECRGDITELRPTLFAAVPTIYDRLKSQVMNQIERSPAWKKALWKAMFNSKKNALEAGQPSPFADQFFGSIAKRVLGGRLRFALSGGAALSPEAHQWLRVVFGCSVLQGYGLTETCGAGTVQELEDLSYANTGPPVPSVEIKLVDVPEMNYLSSASPPKGEIWIRGPSVTRGYYKNDEETSKAYMPGGWFATGDIGQWLDTGCLRIIDRKKNLIKPPHGEYIAIERLESEYKNCRMVHNILVFIDSFHLSCLAFINADVPAVRAWATQQGLPNPQDHAASCSSPELNSYFLRALSEVAQKNHLKPFEFIKGVHVDPVEWTPENNLLTAAMKLNRNVLITRFRPVIDQLYQTLP